MKKAIIGLFCITLFLPLVSEAQLSTNFAGGGNMSIDLEPISPRPNQPFTASLNDFSIGGGGASISWFIDVEERSDARNKRSIELIAPAFGERMEVKVRNTISSGNTIEAVKIIEPSSVDIIIEPKTFVPNFYRGRGLPSSFSTVRAVAITHTSDDVVTYLWKLDSKTLGGGQTSNNSITFTTPLGRRVTLSVDVMNKQGEVVARRAIALPIAEPELLFYETNALKGLVERPVPDNFQFIGSEATFTAVPYNLGTDIFNSNPMIEWTIDGVEQPADMSNPLELTVIRNNIFTGNFQLGFHIRNLSNVMEGVLGQLQIRL